ncbi:hypothetical protein R6Q57_013497 [Mikania cordata]
MEAIIGEDTPWSRLFDMTYAPQYRLITVDFLSTFVYQPQPPDFQPQPQSEISFRLCEGSYGMTLRKFAMMTGLYTQVEIDMPIYVTAISMTDGAVVVSAWWPRIGNESFVRSAPVTRVCDPLISATLNGVWRSILLPTNTARREGGSTGGYCRYHTTAPSAAGSAQLAASSYHRTADSTSGPVGGSVLVADAYRS